MQTTLFILFLSLLFVGVAFSREGPGNFSFQVGNDGSFTLYQGDKVFLESGSLGYHSSGQWNLASSTLSVVSNSTTEGTDSIGSYSAVSYEWAPSNSSESTFGTSIRVYHESQTVLFVQSFPQGSTSPSLGSGDDTSSLFPSFKLPSASERASKTSDGQSEINFLAFYGVMDRHYSGKFSSCLADKAKFTAAEYERRRQYKNNKFLKDNNNEIIDELEGEFTSFPTANNGGSPLILFDFDLNTVVISPASNFMVGLQTVNTELGEFGCGVGGMVNNIPAGYEQAYVLQYGKGIRRTVMEWGDVLLRKSKKPRTPIPQPDVQSNYIGYWTDNGAYYYYVTEKDKNYADTMIDVDAYVQSIGLPIGYYQFDSWWYFKGHNNGVNLWESLPSIFPNGMQDVQSKLRSLPLTLHNRYFSNNSNYTEMFDFIIEEQTALPLNQDVFDYMFKKARSWGMTVYEQDWLISTYQWMEATQNNVSNARNWLINMGKAAEDNQVTLFYCMELPMHALQSTEIPAVTIARTTDDYNPGNTNWKIGHSSMLLHAIGLTPFKDDFWSSDTPQPGCPYRYCIEPNSELNSLVSALSAGGVAPSDVIGQLNSSRIMQSCRADGFILKPDRPVFPLDLFYTRQFSAYENVDQCFFDVWDELWSTSSTNALGTFSYVIAANISQTDYQIYPSDLGWREEWYDANDNQSYVGFEYYGFINDVGAMNNGDKIAVSNVGSLFAFDENTPLAITKQNYSAGDNSPPFYYFHYYVVCPVLPNGWVFLGERAKYIAASAQRFAEATYESGNGGNIAIQLIGAPSETVDMLFLIPSDSEVQSNALSNGNVVLFSCTLSTGGEAKVVCDQNDQSCTCIAY